MSDDPRQIAADPSATPETLEQLSQSAQPEILQALAKNPNAPLSVLFRAGVLFPKEFLENPSLSLFWLEQPNFFGRLPADLMQSLIQYPMPQEWLSQIARFGSEGVKLALIKRKDTPAAVLESIIDSGDEMLIWLIVDHPNTTPALFAKLVRYPSARLRVASHHRAPPEVLCWLLADEEAKVRASAVRNQQTPKELYQLLLRAGASSDCMQMLTPKVPLTEEELKRLAGHNTFARMLVARYPSAPQDLLRALAKDPEHLVREELAKNPSAPLDVMEALFSDPSPMVRGSLVHHPRLPLPLLASLLTQESWIVPHSQLERFVTDANDPAQWEELSLQRPFLRRLIAHHPAVPAPLLMRLAKDRDPRVRLSVARAPAANEAVLRLFSQEQDLHVQEALLENQNTPAELLLYLLSFLKTPRRRNLVARHKNTPPEVLRVLAKDPSASIRAYVAQHPNTPKEELEALCQDPNKNVQRAAERNPNARSLL